MVTHDAQVAAYARRTLSMRDGWLLHEGAGHVIA